MSQPFETQGRPRRLKQKPFISKDREEGSCIQFIIIKMPITGLAFKLDRTEHTNTNTHTHIQSVSLSFVFFCILCTYLIILDTVVFPGGAVVKNPSANAGDSRDTDSLLGSSRYPEVGDDNSQWYSCVENPMNSETWWATVYGSAKSDTNEYAPHT